jgi:LysR family transcriptional regulator, glycine cleavage system transcriptional activator
MTVDWRTLPSIATLRAFQATAQHGGFTGAGRALNVTHAAVAQQVRALERELGVPLVQRLGRAVSLTPQGERLAQSLSDGFTTIAGGIAALQRAEQRRGLRVATSTFIGQTAILPRLPEFWALHPGIEVTMTPADPQFDLRADGFDLGVVGWVNDGPGIELQPIAHTRWVLAGAPSLLGDGPVDTATLPWLDPGELEYEILQLTGVRLDPSKKVNVGTPYLEIAAAVLGMGLIFGTEIIFSAELASGKLREVPFEGDFRTHYSLVLPTGPVRPATQAFVDWVRTLF